LAARAGVLPPPSAPSGSTAGVQPAAWAVAGAATASATAAPRQIFLTWFIVSIVIGQRT